MGSCFLEIFSLQYLTTEAYISINRLGVIYYCGINVDDRVNHEKFGSGIVRRVDHDKLEVAFEKKGVLKVMARFVKKG